MFLYKPKRLRNYMTLLHTLSVERSILKDDLQVEMDWMLDEVFFLFYYEMGFENPEKIASLRPFIRDLKNITCDLIEQGKSLDEIVLYVEKCIEKVSIDRKERTIEDLHLRVLYNLMNRYRGFARDERFNVEKTRADKTFSLFLQILTDELIPDDQQFMYVVNHHQQELLSLISASAYDQDTFNDHIRKLRTFVFMAAQSQSRHATECFAMARSFFLLASELPTYTKEQMVKEFVEPMVNYALMKMAFPLSNERESSVVIQDILTILETNEEDEDDLYETIWTRCKPLVLQDAIYNEESSHAPLYHFLLLYNNLYQAAPVLRPVLEDTYEKLLQNCTYAVLEERGKKNRDAFDITRIQLEEMCHQIQQKPEQTTHYINAFIRQSNEFMLFDELKKYEAFEKEKQKRNMPKQALFSKNEIPELISKQHLNDFLARVMFPFFGVEWLLVTEGSLLTHFCRTEDKLDALCQLTEKEYGQSIAHIPDLNIYAIVQFLYEKSG